MNIRSWNHKIIALGLVFLFTFSMFVHTDVLASDSTNRDIEYSRLYFSYIKTTEAKICADISNPSRLAVTHVGAKLWDSHNNLIAEGQFAITPWTEATGWQTQIFNELMTNTSYYFQLYTVADGETFYSEKKMFTTEKLFYDVDLNGSIEAMDALCILKHTVKLDILEENQEAVADIDKDGDIDAKDALRLLKIIVGLEK